MRLATAACSSRCGGTAVASASIETGLDGKRAVRLGKLFKMLPFAVN
jgi:hypothetical protein